MINLYMTMNMKEKIYYLLFAVLMALFCTACNEEWTDEKLYKKFGLSQEEINCIETSIKPM